VCIENGGRALKVNITKRVVDSLAPKERRYVVWDATTRGFGLRVNKDGTKTFVLKYFNEGKQRWLTLGKYGGLTVEQAKKLALHSLGEAALGEDPVDKKKRQKQERNSKGVSLGEFCADYMKDAHAGKVTYRGRPKKASTLEVDRGRIDRHIAPLLGSKLVAEITSDDVESFKHAVRLGETAATVKTGPRGVARVQGGDTAANRAVGLLGSIMSYAVKLKLRGDNPVRGIERIPDRRKTRAVLPEEYRSLERALSQLEAEAANPWAIQAVRVLMLTGCRRAEIFGLRKSAIDRHHRCLRLDDTKTGQQIRVVGSAALEELEHVPVDAQSRFVFPAARGTGHLVDVKVFRRACEIAGLGDITLHSLRHGFASVAGELGYADATIGVLLGHSANSVTGRYTHIPDPAAQAAADRVSSTIALRMRGEEEVQSSVIELAIARSSSRSGGGLI